MHIQEQRTLPYTRSKATRPTRLADSEAAAIGLDEATEGCDLRQFRRAQRSKFEPRLPNTIRDRGSW